MTYKEAQAKVDVKTYYDKTRLDYRYSWNVRQNMGLHLGLYDDSVSKHDESVLNTNRVMATAARIKAGDHVLDAGCGVGGSTIWLARNIGTSGVGITPVASQIADCKRNKARLGVESVDFVQASYLETPFEDATFDVVWACESLCHTDRKPDFYKEAFRVLKPGGRLVVAEIFRTKRPLDSAQDEELLAASVRPWAIPDVDTSEEHAQNALNAGFVNAKVDDVSNMVRKSSRNLHRNASQWIDVWKAMSWVGIVSKVQVNNALASIRQYEALEKNLWIYAVLTAEKP